MTTCKHCGRNITTTAIGVWVHLDNYKLCYPHTFGDLTMAEPSTNADSVGNEKMESWICKCGFSTPYVEQLGSPYTCPQCGEALQPKQDDKCPARNETSRVAVIGCDFNTHQLSTNQAHEIQRLAERVRELEGQCGVMRQAFFAVITHQGIDHEEGCPEDDTCDCKLARMVNDALKPSAGREMVQKLEEAREALKFYAECCDGCTCGDGWDHHMARTALEKIGGNQ